MKLYICSTGKSLTEDIDGPYNLIAETGEVLASHWCSCKWYAKGDLYENRTDLKRRLEERFGKCECLQLGDDEMTAEELARRNHILFEKEKK